MVNNRANAGTAGNNRATARIDNALHHRATLISSTEGLLELGVYRGENGGRGLRLSYRPGQRRSLELTRMRGGEKIFIASYDRPLTLKKGRRHLLTWTRPDASMSIKLDDQELIRTAPHPGKEKDVTLIASSWPTKAAIMRSAQSKFWVNRW